MFHDVGSYTREHAFEANEPVFAGMNLRVSELTGAVLYAQLPKLDPLLRRLRKRHKVMSKYLSRSNRLKISPHNDSENAVGMSVILRKRKTQKNLRQHSGIERLIETSRHVYTNWVPVLTQRTFNERMNPFKMGKPGNQIYGRDVPNHLDILERTCRVSLGAQYPLAMMRLRAMMLLNSLGT